MHFLLLYIPKTELIEYKNILELFLVNKNSHLDIEHHIYSFYKNINNIDTVGVEGFFTYGVKGEW